MAVNYWTEREKWPYVAPSHYFLPDVFEEVGKAIFGDEWTGLETRDPPARPEIPSPTKVFVGDTDVVADVDLYRKFRTRAHDLLGRTTDRERNLPVSWDEWRRARDRWYEIDLRAPRFRERRATVRAVLQDGAAAGTLIFESRGVNGGSFRTIHPGHWNCERRIADVRFSRCSLTSKIEDAMKPPPAGHLERAEYLRRFNLPLFVARRNARWAVPILAAWHRGELDDLPAYDTSPVAKAPNGPEQSGSASAAPIAEQPSRSAAPIRPDEEKCRALAAQFDQEGIAIRAVKASMISARWNPADGPVPKKDAITTLMDGRPKGRIAKA